MIILNEKQVRTAFEETKSFVKAAKLLGVSYPTYKKAADRYGLTTLTKSELANKQWRLFRDKNPGPSAEELRYFYIDLGYDKQDLELKYGVSYPTIRKWFEKHSIPLRTRAEQIQLNFKKRPCIIDKLVEAGYKRGSMTGPFYDTNIEVMFMKWSDEKSLAYIQQYQINKKGHPYDFYIPSMNLLVEVDGLYWHSSNTAKARDAKHSEKAVEEGYNIIRFNDHEILKTKGKCFERLFAFN